MARRTATRAGVADRPTPGSAAASGPDADPHEVARAIVLRQLTNGPRTRAQLVQAMHRRGVPDDVGEQVLDRFSELGYVDDAAFAQAWVQSRHAGKGLARRALAYELRQRGVADDTLQAAVDAVDSDDERRAAEALVRRRLAGLRAVPAEVATRRLVAMLARKGYSSGLAMAVVREALAAHPNPHPPR
jgi:regulatory protein